MVGWVWVSVSVDGMDGCECECGIGVDAGQLVVWGGYWCLPLSHLHPPHTLDKNQITED